MRPSWFVAAVLATTSVCVATAAGALGGRGSFPPRGAPPPPSPSELHTLAQMVIRDATAEGDPHPTDGVVVPTTRQVAERVDAGAGVDSNQPVYFLVFHGRFTVDRGPLGAALPTGTVGTLTVDARTNRGTDGGVEGREPDLYAIGQPEPLPLPG